MLNRKCRGRVIVSPVYHAATVDAYQGNPWIEGLEPLWSEQEVVQKLRYTPAFNPTHRQMRTPDRVHQLAITVKQWREPTQNYRRVERAIALLMRQGYVDRNPADPTYYTQIQEKVTQLQSPTTALQPSKKPSESQSADTPPSIDATGVAVIGIPGVGKSTCVERILQLYPQVIYHRTYHGNPVPSIQIPWLKIDCPHNGNLKSLCTKYFDEVDDILGTDYARLYPPSLTETKLLHNMALVASIHGLGILVIDELQHLSRLKSGGHRRMLNFFVELVNTIGVPVMLIGNPAAEDLLADEFRQARRMSDVGDIVWDPIPKPPNARVHGSPAPLSEWDYFLQGLWRYQYTRHPLAWDSDDGQAVRSALYEATQGITHFVTRLWIASQERAMDSGRERLSDTIVLSTADDRFRLAKKVLRAIARRDWVALKKFDDVYYAALERLWTTPIEATNPESDIVNWLVAGGVADDIAKIAAKQALDAAGPNPNEASIRQEAFSLAMASCSDAPTPLSSGNRSTDAPDKPKTSRTRRQKSQKPSPSALDLSDSIVDPEELAGP